jgi:DNA-binding LacI/PurR family transcriptional regulator
MITVMFHSTSSDSFIIVIREANMLTGRVTMETIAQHVGVSRVAVSKALRGQSGVSDETREKILETANALGYELQLRETKAKPSLIGVLATSVPRQPYLHSHSGISFYNGLFWEVERVAKELQLGVMACSITPEETSIPPALNWADIAGVLVLGPCKDALLAQLKKGRAPYVIVNQVAHAVTATSVTAAELATAIQLVNMKLERGHRRIGYIGPNGPEWSYSQRWLGYCEAMRAAQLAPAESLALPTNKWFTGEIEELRPQFAALPWSSTTAYVLADARLVYPLGQWLSELDPEPKIRREYASFYHGCIADVPHISVARIDLSVLATEAIMQLKSMIENPKQPARHIAIYPEIVKAAD